MSLCFVTVDDPHRSDPMRAMPPQWPSQGLAAFWLRGQPVEGSVDPAKQASIVTGEPDVTGLCSLREPNGRHEPGPP